MSSIKIRNEFHRRCPVENVAIGEFFTFQEKLYIAVGGGKAKNLSDNAFHLQQFTEGDSVACIPKINIEIPL